jgi:hypothetical protein
MHPLQDDILIQSSLQINPVRRHKIDNKLTQDTQNQIQMHKFSNNTPDPQIEKSQVNMTLSSRGGGVCTQGLLAAAFDPKYWLCSIAHGQASLVEGRMARVQLLVQDGRMSSNEGNRTEYRYTALPLVFTPFGEI